MVVTDDTRTDEIAEALSHLSVDRMAARARADERRVDALSQRIAYLLDELFVRLPQKNPAIAQSSPETSQPLSPRHRPEDFAGPLSGSGGVAEG